VNKDEYITRSFHYTPFVFSPLSITRRFLYTRIPRFLYTRIPRRLSLHADSITCHFIYTRFQRSRKWHGRLVVRDRGLLLTQLYSDQQKY